MTELAARLRVLAEAASPGPWLLIDGFDLHDAGTWPIADIVRVGNPSTKSDPRATAQLIALGFMLPAVVGALEDLLEEDTLVGRTDSRAVLYALAEVLPKEEE